MHLTICDYNNNIRERVEHLPPAYQLYVRWNAALMTLPLKCLHSWGKGLPMAKAADTAQPSSHMGDQKLLEPHDRARRASGSMLVHAHLRNLL